MNYVTRVVFLRDSHSQLWCVSVWENLKGHDAFEFIYLFVLPVAF